MADKTVATLGASEGGARSTIRNPDGESLLLPIRESYWDVGGIARSA